MSSLRSTSHNGFFRLHVDLRRIAGALCSA
jgi:hypothetical protein